MLNLSTGQEEMMIDDLGEMETEDREGMEKENHLEEINFLEYNKLKAP
jgi:hypothetical protein